MVILVVLGIIIAKLYYGNINKSEDPRIKQALVLYGNYNNYVEKNSYQNVLKLLDSIERIYRSVNHYKNSYEMGVLNNNRGAVYLSIALHECDSGNARYINLDKAEKYFKNSITIYRQWLDTFGGLNEKEIYKHIRKDFKTDNPAFKGYDVDNIRANRVEDIIDSQTETPRRLSVTYTNLGIINRHRHQFREALSNYRQALDLWEENHTARNNLNILLGKPIQKRNILQKLFPPERID